MGSVLIGIDASRINRPHLTGTEHYTLHVLRAVLSQDQRNAFRLYLGTEVGPGLLPTHPRVEQRVIPLPRLWTQVGLSREMLAAPPDVLFVPSHVLPVIHARRSVVVVYDVGHRFFPRAHRLTERLYAEWAIRRHVRLATRLITISEASKRDLVSLYRADPSRIAVAYPAVDERFTPRPAEEVQRARGRYALPERYVLHVGTVKPRKNLPRLIAAFAAARLPRETHLVLAGKADFGLPAVERAIAESGAGDRIHLLRYVDGGDLPALYSGAACTAVVSLYEGFGMPALEALACGAPLVVSDRGSLPEAVGNAALVVDALDTGSIADGVSRLVNDRQLAERLREAGERRARHFTWAEAGRVTLETLEAAGRGAARPSAALG